VRLLHTSDWHLGRSFFGVSLLEDQAHALDQLVALASEAAVDAVLLAGDVYDRSSPPTDAVRLLDDTLTRLVVGAGIPVVVIAGNHDSGERLGFGSRLLTERGLHLAGTQPRVVTLGDAFGPIDVVAVPFAEPAATAARTGDATIVNHDAALRADLASATAAAAGPEQPGGPGKPGRKKDSPSPRRRIAVSHAFVSGGSTSESERPLVMGNAALVAADCFDGFAYAALGHLHRPQRIGRNAVRYSGSLLKYSFDEATQRKSVSVVEIDAAGSCTIEEVALAARRDVRILEGTLDELQRASAADTSRDDYVLARLADRGAVIDAMGKLRALYPNCLHVQRDEFFAVRGEDEAARVDLRRHSESELFDAFFRDVTGEAASDDETRAFADALTAVRRAAAEET
jgi:exonuclease SbcD